MSTRLLAAMLMLPFLADCVARLAPPEPEEAQADSAREASAAVVANEYSEMIERVLRISGPLRTAGVPLCRDRVAPLLGIDVEQRIAGPDFPHFWDVYLRTFGVEKEVTVTIIDPSSPAARAGVRSGDRILALDGRRVRRAFDVFEILHDEPERAPRLRLERDGATLELEIERAPLARSRCGWAGPRKSAPAEGRRTIPRSRSG